MSLSTFIGPFTPPESAPSGPFWGICALIGGVRVNAYQKQKV